MLSLPLFKQTTKANGVLWSVLTVVSAALLAQFAALEMTQSLLFLIFYGVMAMILPGVYIMVSSNKLFASQIDRGSLAYVLSTPKKRSTIAFTQLLFSVGSITLLFLILTLVHIGVNAHSPLDLTVAGAAAGVYGISGNLTAAIILKINLSALLVCLAMSGVCYMFSGIFNLSKFSIGFGGAFVGISVLSNMMAMFGSLGVDVLENFKYLSICTLYDYKSILLGTDDWITKGIAALIVAVVSYTIGTVTFCKKDLPL
ncbi:MAG: hypothetical protein IJV15_11725 [Lachnospiraceae bacterium]|nr:hypothetical protein [Lachnospiraceae bacterium]MBR1599895.1 hypothetical protein [Lachnospiraceae bacterium]